jgi:D-tyrosyl-tRNA(Tyr) deacylase
MRIVLQRVQRAGVVIEERMHASIGKGFLVLLGVEEEDGPEDVAWLAAKVCAMRLFGDEEGKMNLDLRQVDGDLLVVSQFTLHASAKKGNRPSFIKAARPEKAIPLYEQFIKEVEQLLDKPCQTGVFGADMQVELVNDGPVTIILDSKSKE